MKLEKHFDCVEMKAEIQERLLREVHPLNAHHYSTHQAKPPVPPKSSRRVKESGCTSNIAVGRKSSMTVERALRCLFTNKLKNVPQRAA